MYGRMQTAARWRASNFESPSGHVTKICTLHRPTSRPELHSHVRAHHSSKHSMSIILHMKVGVDVLEEKRKENVGKSVSRPW